MEVRLLETIVCDISVTKLALVYLARTFFSGKKLDYGRETARLCVSLFNSLFAVNDEAVIRSLLYLR